MKENPDVRWNKWIGGLWARFYPVKFPTCEKQLKKSLGMW